jgi:hypothetical protein
LTSASSSATRTSRPERLLDVVLGEATVSAEAVEDGLETLRQGFEHGGDSSASAADRLQTP